MRYKKLHIAFIFLSFTPFFAVGQIKSITTYYDIDSTLVKEIININTENQLTGRYESFFASGGKKAVGFYEDNKPDSLWNYYYENGNIKAKGFLKSGKKTGTWEHFYENGHIRMTGEMSGEKRVGKWTFYYENGKEKSIGIYENNEKEKIWNYFYEDGKLKAQAYYEKGSGEYKELYPSGALKMEGYNNKQKSSGKWKYYYESGELQAEGFFKVGSKTGSWKYYHKNGNISAVGNFVNGRKNGLWKYYYGDGKLRSEGIEKDGQKEGSWKLYYESGATKGQGNFDSGSGKYFEFYENGKQKSSGNVLNGKNEGKWVYFNESGHEEGYAIFRRGIGKYKGYYEDGSIKMEGTIEDNKRTGIWKLYNTDGSIAGYYKPVYEDDKPIFKTAESFERDKKFDKPEYRVRKNRSRYFKPVVNEYKGIAVSTNPMLGFIGFIPLSFERYTQERLGYELTVSYLNAPFLKRKSKLGIDDNYYIGFSLSFRQKLYSKDRSTGMFYFGHQVYYGNLNHSVKVNEPAISAQSFTAKENNYSYDLLIGTRWLKNPENGGFTWDAHIGIGIGYQSFIRDSNPALNPTINSYFNEVDGNGLFFPIRFGITLGYLGPKKNTTPIKIKS